MATTDGGKWLIGLFIYFSLFFVITFSVIGSQVSMGNDPDVFVADPGFLNQESAEYSDPGYCSGTVDSIFCSALPKAISNETCNYVSGCSWDDTKEECYGEVQSIICTPNTNRSTCDVLGCSYVSYTEDDDFVIKDVTKDSKVILTLQAMSGFSADLGVPDTWRWLFGLIFFWLPSLVFIYALYMAFRGGL